MKGTVKIGVVGGVPVRLHWTMAILVVFAIGPGVTARAALAEAGWIVAIFGCVLVHELAHTTVAHRRGLAVRGIVLMPLGGFSEIVGLVRRPRDEAVVSLAGPIANVVLAIAFAGAALALHEALWPPTLFARAWLVRLAWANVLLGCLNLIPALPFDGGRALRGELARTRDRASATELAMRVARVVAVLLIVAGLLVDVWLTIFGALILFEVLVEHQMVLAGQLLSGVRVRDVMIPERTGLQANEAVASAGPFIRQFKTRAFPVLSDGAVIGIVAASDLDAHRRAVDLGHAADTTAPTLDVSDALYPDAVEAFAEAGRTSLVVEDGAALAGVLYRADMEAMLRRRASMRRVGDGRTTA